MHPDSSPNLHLTLASLWGWSNGGVLQVGVAKFLWVLEHGSHVYDGEKKEEDEAKQRR